MQHKKAVTSHTVMVILFEQIASVGAFANSAHLPV